MLKSKKKNFTIKQSSIEDNQYSNSFRCIESLNNGNLFFTNYTGTELTTLLRIYEKYSLNKVLFEKKIDKHWTFLAVLKDNSILMQSLSFPHPIIKIDYELNLTYLVQDDYKDLYYVFALKDDRFFAVTEINPGSIQLEFFSCKDNRLTFLHQLDFPDLSNRLNREYSNPMFISLSNGRYAAQIWKDNDFYILVFRIIFDVLQQKNILDKVTCIKPKRSNSNRPNFRALANGTLLTYGARFDIAQIWDPQTGGCIKEWSWKQHMPKPFHYCAYVISCFPAANYLLIQESNKLCVFNTNTLKASVIQYPILEGFDLSFHQYITPRADLVLISNKCCNNKTAMKIHHLELKTLEPFRKREKLYRQSQLRCGFFFNREVGFPPEMSEIIINLAFNKKTKEQFMLEQEGSTPNQCVLL